MRRGSARGGVRAAALAVARAPAALLCAVALAAVSGCGGTGPFGPSPVPSGLASASAVVVSSTPSVEPSVGPSAPPASATTSAAPGASSGPSVDPSLLDLLPSTLGGLDVQHLAEYDAIVATDPQVVQSADRFVTAFVADAAGGEFATGPLVHLRPGVMTDQFFRDWRDSFDEGACSQAGGVTGHAEGEIAGRQVFIGTCAGGAHTYHVWLAKRGVLVSVNAVGQRRLGEQLVAALRE